MIFLSSCAVYHDIESNFKRTTLRMKKQNKGKWLNLTHVWTITVCLITDLCAQYVFFKMRFCMGVFAYPRTTFQIQNSVSFWWDHLGLVYLLFRSSRVHLLCPHWIFLFKVFSFNDYMQLFWCQRVTASWQTTNMPVKLFIISNSQANVFLVSRGEFPKSNHGCKFRRYQ